MAGEKMGLFQELYSIGKEYAKSKALEFIDEAVNSNYNIKLNNNKLSFDIKSPNKSKIELILEDNNQGNIYASKVKVALNTPFGKVDYRR